MVEVWEKVYAMAVKVEVEWMDNVSAENPVLPAGQHFAVRLVPFSHHRLKGVQSTGHI